MRPRFAVLVVCLSIPSWTLASDWPQWRGPNRDNISPETGLLKQWPKGGPKLLWNSKDVTKTNIGIGYSSIALADGRIYTMGDIGEQGFVHCLDASTGAMMWSTVISPKHGDGGPRCTPTVDGDRVYALSPQGILVCLQRDNGAIRWKKHLENDFGGQMMSSWRYSESPTVDGGKLVCTPGGDSGGLVALNKYDGSLIWKAKTPDCGGAGYASIVIAEVGGFRQYITLMGPGKGGGLVGVDAKTGALLWNYPKIANGTANIPTSLVQGDLVFCSTGYGTGAALLKMIPSGDGIRIEEQYFFKGNQLQNHHGGMVLLGDYVYGGHGHNQGHPFCLNMKTGKFAWGPKENVGDGSAAVAYADGNLYFRYQNNKMALIEATPKGYNMRSSFDLPKGLGTGWQVPVIINGCMYIRGNNQLLCYDVKAR